MYAARQGSLEAARVLVDAGADKSARDPDLSTPAIIATINSHYDVAAMLVERGADPNLTDTAGMAVLYAAVDMNMPARSTGGPTASRRSTISALELMTRLLEHGGEPERAAAFGDGAAPRTRPATGCSARARRADACREDR